MIKSNLRLSNSLVASYISFPSILFIVVPFSPLYLVCLSFSSASDAALICFFSCKFFQHFFAFKFSSMLNFYYNQINKFLYFDITVNTASYFFHSLKFLAFFNFNSRFVHFMFQVCVFYMPMSRNLFTLR